MQTFGAVDVNFYRDGKPLQLRKGKKARITIPVSNITRHAYGEKLPRTMPLLVYDKKAGEWVRDGNNLGELNEKGTAYVAEVSHFSVFNMDEEFGTPTCYKMCASGIPLDAEIEVSVPNHIKTFRPFGAGCTGNCTTGSPCPNDCFPGEEAHVVFYMAPNQPMSVRIADNGGTVQSSYVFIAGGPSTPHETNCSNSFAGCSGPGHISFGDECWKTMIDVGGVPTPDGTMTAPIVAANFDEINDKIDLSWVFVQKITADQIDNEELYYMIQYATPSSTTSFTSIDDLTWKEVDFDPSPLATISTFPDASAPTGSNDWRFKIVDVDFSGVGGSNDDLDPTSPNIILFRVNYATLIDLGTPPDFGDPANFTKGEVYIRNKPVSGGFASSFASNVNCNTE